MRNWTALVSLTLLLLALAFCACVAQGAPAPVPKRTRGKPCPFPASCTMVFCGIRYAATFSPDGNYTAAGGQTHWVGSWSLGSTPRGRTLVIHERLRSDHSWMTFVVPLDGALRRGAENYEGKFLLE